MKKMGRVIGRVAATVVYGTVVAACWKAWKQPRGEQA